MEKEEKDLLLKDLCARLPYGVVIEVDYLCNVEWQSKYPTNKDIDTLKTIDLNEELVVTNGYSSYDIEEIKPYLRPLTDITDEEIMERLVSKYGKGSDEVDGFIDFKKHTYDTQCMVDVKFARYKDTEDETRYFTLFAIDGYNASYDDIDWLNEHYFDYRGLIRKGLALKAPKDMYNAKK